MTLYEVEEWVHLARLLVLGGHGHEAPEGTPARGDLHLLPVDGGAILPAAKETLNFLVEEAIVVRVANHDDRH